MRVPVKHYEENGYHYSDLETMMRRHLDERNPDELKEAFITLVVTLVGKEIIDVEDACMMVPGMSIEPATDEDE